MDIAAVIFGALAIVFLVLWIQARKSAAHVIGVWKADTRNLIETLENERKKVTDLEIEIVRLRKIPLRLRVV